MWKYSIAQCNTVLVILACLTNGGEASASRADSHAQALLPSNLLRPGTLSSTSDSTRALAVFLQATAIRSEPRARLDVRLPQFGRGRNWRILGEDQRSAALAGMPSYRGGDFTGSVEPCASIQIKKKSKLSGRSKDFYELASGNIAIFMRWDEETEALKREFYMLQAIEKAGVRVAKHELVKLKRPHTGRAVWAMIQEKIPGKHVMLNDETAPETLFRSVCDSTACDAKAANNLKKDMIALSKSYEAGFKIEDLQGIVKPDGHFVVIDPLSVRLCDGSRISNRWLLTDFPDAAETIASTLRLLNKRL